MPNRPSTLSKLQFGWSNFPLPGSHGHNKYVIGTPENDVLNGTAKNDVIYALDSDDSIFADAGNDTVYGGRGSDLIDGGEGNDSLYGEKGNDALVGGDGKDFLSGGHGRDFLVGGEGDDTLDGGADSDTFVFRVGMDKDHVKNFQLEDRLDLRDFGFASQQAALDAFKQVGHDAVLDLGNGDKLILDDFKVSHLTTAQLITSDLVKGVSSSQTPYLVNIDADVSFTSLITTGDQVGFKDDGVTPWRFAGTPDGIGAFDNGDGTFTVLTNHEFTPGAGAIRDHGSTGAFVSELIIDKTTLQVVEAKDLIEDVHLYNTATSSFVDATTQFNRFCSADLADASAFYNSETGLGYNGGRIFLNGEEAGTEGRAFAHFASGLQIGNSYELPWLGKLAHENAVASAHTGDKTVVATMDDGQNGQVYFYFGDKTDTGSDLQKAGLIGGHLWGLKVAEIEGATPAGADNNETIAANPLGADETSAFSLVDLGDASTMTGVALDSASEAAGVTTFLRPEDGAWNTINHNRFYFVTTSAYNGTFINGSGVSETTAGASRLWAVDFTDATRPQLGGSIHLMLNGSEGHLLNGTNTTPQMMDNITVNNQGHVIIQEDIGNNSHLGKIWDYDPVADTITFIAQHDPDRFDPAAPVVGQPFLTQDEESSGIIDVSDILGSAGQNVYLLDVQAHYPNGPELVEGGQLLLMHQDIV